MIAKYTFNPLVPEPKTILPLLSGVVKPYTKLSVRYDHYWGKAIPLFHVDINIFAAFMFLSFPGISLNTCAKMHLVWFS